MNKARRKLAIYERLKEELDERINTIFSLYCSAMNIRRAYGVESWTIDYWNSGGYPVLKITQDTSAMNCYNSVDHCLPVEWFDIEDRTELETTINAWAAKENKAEDRKARKEMLAEAATLQARADALIEKAHEK